MKTVHLFYKHLSIIMIPCYGQMTEVHVMAFQAYDDIYIYFANMNKEEILARS